MDRSVLVYVAVWVALGLTVGYLLQPEPEQTIDLGRDISRPGE